MNKTSILKLLYRAGIPKILRLSKRNHLTILCLHQISDDADFFFSPIKPRLFEQLVKYLLKHYTIIGFNDFADIKKPLAKPALILSFDDGYYDFYENALPILDKYKLVSNHNVVTECADTNAVIWTQRLNYIFNHCRENDIELKFDAEDLTAEKPATNREWLNYNLKALKHLLQMPRAERMKLISEKENEFSLAPAYRMMNWREIAECSKHLVEIGSHTYSHDALPTVSDRDALRFEIVESKAAIERRVGKPVDILALPNGQGNEKIDDLARAAGYKHLLYVNDGVNKFPDAASSEMNVFERILLVDESPAEMVLRTEAFHTKVRKYI